MRAFLMSFMMLLSSLAFADTVDTRTFSYVGDTPQMSVNTSTEETKTVYRMVTIRTTCQRTEYRNRCTNEPRRCRRECRAGRCRNVCTPPRRVCRRVPVRRNYPCTKRVRRAFEEHDYFVETNAVFNFDNSRVTGSISETFEVQTTGQSTKLNVNGTGNYAVLLTNKRKSENMQGDTKFVDLEYDIKFVPARLINGTLRAGIQDVSLNSGVLTFSLGKRFNKRDFVQNLKVYNSRRLRSDILLFEQNLLPEEMQVEKRDNRSFITVDLNALGIQVPSRTRVIMTTSFDLAGAKLLNKDDISLEASANWILTN